VERFLSSLIALGLSWYYILFEARKIPGGIAIWMNGFFLLQLIGVAWLMTQSKTRRNYIPLAYALVVSLCMGIGLFSASNKFGSWRQEEIIDLGFVNLSLTMGLIALYGWAAGSIKKLNSEPVMLASIFTLMLGFISIPGLLLSMALMILGYAKHEKLLIIAGLLLMPPVLCWYYYNVDITLIQKSEALVASGIALLLGRYYIQYRGWDKTEEVCEQK
jgi:uncharacterized membrane protein